MPSDFRRIANEDIDGLEVVQMRGIIAEAGDFETFRPSGRESSATRHPSHNTVPFLFAQESIKFCGKKEAGDGKAPKDAFVDFNATFDFGTPTAIRTDKNGLLDVAFLQAVEKVNKEPFRAAVLSEMEVK